MTIKTRATIASVAVLATAALGAAGALVDAAAADAAPARVPACTGSQLALHVNHKGFGAAGHDGLALEYRNISHRTCTVTGYPGVDAYVGHSRLDSARRVRGPLTVRTITVRPGKWTSALVDWNTIGHDGKPCAGGTSLRVTAPNTTRTIRLAKTPTGCDLKVHPSVAGRKAGLTG